VLTSATRAELPKYDVQLHCKTTMAIFTSNQEFMTKACIETELKAKARLPHVSTLQC